MSSRSNKQSGLGKALKNRLQKRKNQQIGNRTPIFFQQTQQNDAQVKKAKLKSIITQNSLQGFLHIAQMSQQDFHANRDIKFKQIREQMRNKKIITTKQKKYFLVQELVDQKILHKLQLPRRPQWKNLTKQQLQKKQSQAYLNWRRGLAMIEEKNTQIQITPYQKNIQVWKQLWRVVDRSDMIIQIVDGRDPLFFRGQDLVQYVKQINPNKKSLLLVNKSDLVSSQKIKMWNQYFIKQGIDHIFFSAMQQIKANQLQTDVMSQTTEQSKNYNINKFINSPEVLSVGDLIQLMDMYSHQFNKEKIQIGLVGYPNVGKSSVINAVFGKKKVAVASLPGKTKHFQTLPLSNKVTLCDCPGLVFPRISSSFAEMVLNGLIPIDTIRAYEQPMQILSLRIKKKDICQLYALHWKQDQVYDGDKILQKFAMLRGFYGGNGLPNKSISARHILKDYVNGILKYAKHPPGYIPEQLKQQQNNQNQTSKNHLQKIQNFQKQQIQGPQTQINMKRKILQTQKLLDGQFFGGQQKQLQLNYQQIVKQLTQDDLMDIVQGRKLPNLNVTKQMRKQIKFAFKRGDKIQEIKKKVFLVNLHDKDLYKHKQMIKV